MPVPRTFRAPCFIFISVFICGRRSEEYNTRVRGVARRRRRRVQARVGARRIPHARIKKKKQIRVTRRTRVYLSDDAIEGKKRCCRSRATDENKNESESVTILINSTARAMVRRRYTR